MLIRGGEIIYPKEIEECVFNHPLVADVAVLAFRMTTGGEEIVAWIKLHSNKKCSAKEIQDFCKTSLAHFKIPRHIKFVKAFTMIVTGKLQKFKMREETIAELAE